MSGCTAGVGGEWVWPSLRLVSGSDRVQGCLVSCLRRELIQRLAGHPCPCPLSEHVVLLLRPQLPS